MLVNKSSSVNIQSLETNFHRQKMNYPVDNSTYQNQLTSLPPNSFYVSTIPVQPSSQVFNRSHIMDIPLQPQIITTQAAGNMLNQAQLIGLRTVNPLQPGLSCAPSTLQPYQNSIFFYNPQSGIPMAVNLPVAAPLQPTPTSSASAIEAPPKKKYKLMSKDDNLIATSSDSSPFLSNQPMTTTHAEVNNALPTPKSQQKFTAVHQTESNQMQIVNNETISTGIKNKPGSIQTKILPQKCQTIVAPYSKILQKCTAPTPSIDVSSISTTLSTLNIAPSTGASVLSSNTWLATTDAYVNQLPSASVAQQKFVAGCSTDPNPTVEVPVVSMAPSSLTVESSTMSVMTKSSTEMDTSFSSVDTITSSVPTVSSDFNSKPSFSTVHNKAVITSEQTNTAEIMTTSEHLNPLSPNTTKIVTTIENSKPSSNTTDIMITTEHLKPPQQLASEPVKDKQKTVVKPQILTHVINGFIIQESLEPFPMYHPTLLDLPCGVLSPDMLNSPEEREYMLTGGHGSKCEKFTLMKRFQMRENTNTVPAEENPSAFENELAVSSKTGEINSAPEDESIGSYKIDEDNSAPENESLVSGETRGENSVPENESTVSFKTGEENSAPASDSPPQTPMVVVQLNDEVEKSKSDLSQKLLSNWTVQDVFEFIQNFPGCSGYADNFKSHEIDGQALLLLNANHLTAALCMKLGPALKLISHIRSMEDEIKSQLNHTLMV